MNQDFGFLDANVARSEDLPAYVDVPLTPSPRTEEDTIIRNAVRILAGRVRTQGFNNPDDVKKFLLCRQPEGHEVFSVMYFTATLKLIRFEDLFRGTLMQVSAYPREVVKMALQLNAAAVVFSHNHPSGEAKPSEADIVLTQQMKAALALIDVRVLDHIIVAGGDTFSMAARGLM